MANGDVVEVSDLVAEALDNLGTLHVFGIIGASSVHLIELIARCWNIETFLGLGL